MNSRILKSQAIRDLIALLKIYEECGSGQNLHLWQFQRLRHDQTPADRARWRRIISLNGPVDPLIPYTGGTSVIVHFMPAQENIYRFAQAMGETRPPVKAAPEDITGTGMNGYLAPFVKFA